VVKQKEQIFSFTKENDKKAKAIIAKYPKGRQRSAVMPLLDMAQRQNSGWLSREVMDYVAGYLTLPAIKVYEVATFYSMYNLKPVGKNFIQVCRTTPCWLRGSDKLTETCKNKLGIDFGEVTQDGEFSLIEVECLGACVNAPIVQINDDYYEDISPEQLEEMLDDIKAGKKLKVGSQIGRQCSAPINDAALKKVEVSAVEVKKTPAKKMTKKETKTKK
jgi:NADH-quinone oxidoreductase E subunit